MNTLPVAASLRFGRFELQPHERRLLVAGEPAPLGARALDLLQVLAERAGQLVGKHALMDLVWPDVVVEDNNLAAQISALRKVLGGDVIATIPGRGYRFTAKLDAAGPVESPSRASPADTGPSIAAAAPTVPPTNLPAELPPLLGRSDDLAALGTLIDQHRLVSVVGAGGMGKTLLTQHLLDARRGAYPHGVCWVELAPVSDPAALPGAIAAAMGVQGGSGDPLAALVRAVAPLSLLLALDNAEHLLADVAHVCQTLRDVAPGLRMVVTSQAPLNAAAERLYRIGPLAVPEGPLPASQALEFGAVALFAERAQAVDARFSLTDANAPTVIELCRALDGLALAIELAAARAPLLGVQRLAASMQDRLKLLTASRNRAAPARQQTLRAALEWSHSLLDEREQVVFRRLAVMAGSASLELIQRVIADPPDVGGLDDWAVMDALGVLLDRSLVAVMSTEAEDATLPRYRLLDSPRVYALEQLVEAGEHEAIRQRHALAVAAQFDAAWDEFFSGGIGCDDWMHKMSFDLCNAREALTWAGAAGDAASALAIGATLLRALPPPLYTERMALAERCEALISPAAPMRLQQRAWVQICVHIGDRQKHRGHDAAERAVSLARVLYNEDHDSFTLYLALCRLACMAAAVGNMNAGMTHLVELRALEDPVWPPQRLYFGADVAGLVANNQGNAAEALQYTRRAVALSRARGQHVSLSQVNLIDIELAAGNAAAAVRIGTDLVAVLARTRDEYSLNFARLNLAAAWLVLNELGEARLVAQAGWPQAARFCLHQMWADHLTLLAALEERPQDAARLAGYADATYVSLDDLRQANEAASADRALKLVRANLGEHEYDRLYTEGTTLSDADISDLAFGTS